MLIKVLEFEFRVADSTKVKLQLVFILFCFLAQNRAAKAQWDPATSLLLRPSNTRATEDSNSGRYKVIEAPPQDANRANDTVSPVPLPADAYSSSPQVTDGPTTSETRGGPNEGAHLTSDPPLKAPENLKIDVQPELLPSPQDETEDAEWDADRRRFHPQDFRRQLVNLSLGLGYLYNDSSSSTWARDYHNHAPMLELDGSVWLSHELGLAGWYHMSRNARIDREPGSSAGADLDHIWYGAAVRYRQSFGFSRLAPALTLSLNYEEFQSNLSSSVVDRSSIRSSGFGLGAMVDIPSNEAYRWQLGFNFYPLLDHAETSAENAIQSGTKNESDRLELKLGGQYILSQHYQIFWHIRHSIERNSFTGAASPATQPVTGESLTDTQAINSFTILSIGFSWGD